MKILTRWRALWALGLALGGTPLWAHDLWIAPTDFSPSLQQIVGLRLRVGQDLDGEPLPLIPGLVNEFVVQDAAERRPVAGRRGADPAGAMRVGLPGLHVIGYYSHPSRVELAPEKFDAYLAEEGLDSVIAARAGRAESGAKVRELYLRCAKSLVSVGPPSDTQRDRALGFPLELVAEGNPYAMRAGRPLPVRLTFQGEPLPGALVVAINSLNPQQKQHARSDADGRVRLSLPPGGMWLIKAVHMVAAPAGSDADWTSYWASLTFEPGAASEAK